MTSPGRRSGERCRRPGRREAEVPRRRWRRWRGRSSSAHRRSRRSTSTGCGVTGWRAAGWTVELAPVEVTIYAMELLAWRAPDAEFRVTVSPGTYVRAHRARRRAQRSGPGRTWWRSAGKRSARCRWRMRFRSTRIEGPASLQARRSRCWRRCGGCEMDEARAGRTCSTGGRLRGRGREDAQGGHCRPGARRQLVAVAECSECGRICEPVVVLEVRWVSSGSAPRAPPSPSARSTACTSRTTRCCRRRRVAPRPPAGPCVVVTFDPHPVEVVRPERAPLRLTTEVERRAAMAACGVEHALVLRFDAALAALPPEQFVREHPDGALRHARTGHRARSRVRARAERRRRHPAGASARPRASGWSWCRRSR